MTRRLKPLGRGGFTLSEVMIAMSIGLLVGGTTLLLLIQSAQTNAMVFSDVTLDEAANTLQSKIVSHIRAMGGGGGAQGAVYTNLPGAVAPPGLCYYLRVPYQMADVGSTALAQIGYDPASGTITYCTNYTSPTGQEILLSTNANVTVASFGFFPSIKGNGDNTLDLTLANVEIELVHTTFFPMPKTNTVWRTFSVRMRTFP
ncbi:MAG: prepilin-type N-terminal cleavage/methylation domain-containing protein [Limisphaerales bacterium]